eukprot:3477873-Rhodomonas_salina.3
MVCCEHVTSFLEISTHTFGSGTSTWYQHSLGQSRTSPSAAYQDSIADPACSYHATYVSTGHRIGKQSMLYQASHRSALRACIPIPCDLREYRTSHRRVLRAGISRPETHRPRSDLVAAYDRSVPGIA